MEHGGTGTGQDALALTFSSGSRGSSRREASCTTGQGKVVSGRVAAAWAFTCHWRTDGNRLWSSPTCSGVAVSVTPVSGSMPRCAAIRRRGWSRGCPSNRTMFWRRTRTLSGTSAMERKLPVNRRSARQVETGRIPKTGRGSGVAARARTWSKPVGFVLPLQRGTAAEIERFIGMAFQCLWMLRARHLFLLPGDSPVGFRLPLD